MFRVACVIPTYNGLSEIGRLLDSLERQEAQFDILAVDSSSTDGTYELLRSRLKNVSVIPGSDFNHGGTRQKMVHENPQYDIYVFLTQDAMLEDEFAIERILVPFNNSEVGAVCGRQLPHYDATPIAAHARIFNYPDITRVKSIDDVPELGLKTAFISNSFSAYRRTTLMHVGGFPVHVIFAEDMFVAGKMILAGFKVVFAGEARCRHSHNYSISQEFKRYFDMGVFHARESWVRQCFGGAGGEGLRFVLSELKFLGFKRLFIWPEAILRNIAKFAGYNIGQYEKCLPISIKRNFSMYKRYWDGPYR